MNLNEWECNICGLLIKSKEANLRRHKLLHGPLVEQLECSICGQKCSNKYNFRKHCENAHKDGSVPTAKIGFKYAEGI